MIFCLKFKHFHPMKLTCIYKISKISASFFCPGNRWNSWYDFMHCVADGHSLASICIALGEATIWWKDPEQPGHNSEAHLSNNYDSTEISFDNHSDILHRARQSYCQTLCKISEWLSVMRFKSSVQNCGMNFNLQNLLYAIEFLWDLFSWCSHRIVLPLQAKHLKKMHCMRNILNFTDTLIIKIFTGHDSN